MSTFERQRIVVNKRATRDITADALDALVAHGAAEPEHEIFEMHGTKGSHWLVDLVSGNEKLVTAGDGQLWLINTLQPDHLAGTLTDRPLDKPRLSGHLDRAADFVKDIGDGTYEPTRVPSVVVADIFAMAQWPMFRSLQHTWDRGTIMSILRSTQDATS